LARAAVTIGNFDGVHLGHAAIVRRLVAADPVERDTRALQRSLDVTVPAPVLGGVLLCGLVSLSVVAATALRTSKSPGNWRCLSTALRRMVRKNIGV
jgi:hypothetical protein